MLLKVLGGNKKIAAKIYFKLLLVTVKSIPHIYKEYLSLFRVPTVAGNLEI